MKKLLLVGLFLLLPTLAFAGPFVGGGLNYAWTNELDVFKNRGVGQFEVGWTQPLGGLAAEVSVARDVDITDSWFESGDYQMQAVVRFYFW